MAYDEVARQLVYWRTRAEKLTDAALVRRQAISEPTMVEPPPKVQPPQRLIVQAMQVQEFEEKKH